jgi:flagellar biosynthesis protein FliR
MLYRCEEKGFLKDADICTLFDAVEYLFIQYFKFSSNYKNSMFCLLALNVALSMMEKINPRSPCHSFNFALMGDTNHFCLN